MVFACVRNKENGGGACSQGVSILQVGQTCSICVVGMRYQAFPCRVPTENGSNIFCSDEQLGSSKMGEIYFPGRTVKGVESMGQLDCSGAQLGASDGKLFVGIENLLIERG